MVKNLPVKAGDSDSIPGPRRRHTPQGNQACLPQLLSKAPPATEARAPPSRRSGAGGAAATGSLHTATREEPPLSAAGEHLRAATQTKHNHKYIKIKKNQEAAPERISTRLQVQKGGNKNDTGTKKDY